MAISVYTPPSDRIIHNTAVDFGERWPLGTAVNIMQYDKTLPIIAVSLYSGGQPYTIPSSADLNVRVGKSDGTKVYNPVLGCNSTRNVAYIEVTRQISAVYGPALATLELIIEGNIAHSSYILLDIAKNPAPDDAIESTNEYKSLFEAINGALQGAQGITLGLTGAAVGQVPAVKTIDEQGQPTQWEATALPNEAFIVHFTRKRQLGGNPILTSDRTPEEVIAAIEAKKQVIALLEEGYDITQLCNIAKSIGYLYFYTIGEYGDINGIGWDIEDDIDGGKTYTLVDAGFGSFIRYEGLLGQNQIFGTGDIGNYEFKQHILFENLPEVTASDNGKFMRVVNGAWKAATIDNANGVSF